MYKPAYLFLAFLLLSVSVLHGRISTEPPMHKDSTQDTFDIFCIGANTTAPDAETILHPSRPVTDTVACTLRIFLPHGKEDAAPVQVVLHCNRRPDSTPPVLVIEGQRLEKLSESSCFRVQNGVESNEYEYRYKFYPSRNGYFSCHAPYLAFNGTNYEGSIDFSAPAIEADNDRIYPRTLHSKRAGNKNILPLLILLALEWLLLKIRYRRESEVALAEFVLRTHRLPLNTSWALTHYGLSLILFYVAGLLTILCFHHAMSDNTTPHISALNIRIIFTLLAFGILSWRKQSRKLHFIKIETTLDHEALINALSATGEHYDWIPDHVGDDCIVAHTTPSSVFSLTWGEQIFVVFDKECVWVNSVNSLDKRTAIFSFGHTRRNIQRVEEAIRNKEQAHHPTVPGN